ncbi:hypothetical protein ILUMI_12847 [Ignelater luminosus]|uniref:Exonuclease domain-containing protein n=1 Tax=Ignelater luminosus TaxID=2038154 RepID=A0A8K0CYU2_IGNLU|nr:hypothetical protein ILUMI_12847 [Ignelater luminosus]
MAKLENELDVLMKALSLGENTIGTIKDASTASSFKRDNCKIVIYDLEATGLSSTTAELCQIAAYYKGQEFSVYTIPSKGIPDKVSAITGLVIARGKMLLDKKPLTTVPILDALQSFLEFLEKIGNVVLVAHNGFCYDAPLILHQMKNHGLLDRFKNVVQGFADTLPILRKQLPDRVKEKKKFNQSTLAEEFVNPTDIKPAHNAINDVCVLHKLLEKLCVSENIIKSEAIGLEDFLKHRESLDKKKCNENSLKHLGDAISKYMREKMAKEGINLERLELTFDDFGEDGIRLLLSNVIKRDRDRILLNIINKLKDMKKKDVV